MNDEGRALRRYKRMRDGREFMLFDDRRFYGAGLVGLLASFVEIRKAADALLAGMDVNVNATSRLQHPDRNRPCEENPYTRFRSSPG